MQRRTLLKLGATAGAVLVVAGGAAAWIEPGWERGGLSATGREIFVAVGKAVLDQTLPAQEGAREIAINSWLSRVNVLIDALPSHVQKELSQLLALLGNPAGRRTLARLHLPWPEASVTDVQLALQDMRLSSLALRQQAYAALHDITAGAYFSDPSSWAVLGYPGPLKI
ncbi:MAG: hypothetical protein H7228_08065 [Polaromonas sp.]|nr:hypothetical protein [Polaromonas sp.]